MSGHLKLPEEKMTWDDEKRRELEWDTSNDLIKEFWKGKRPGDKTQPKQQTTLEKFKVM